jgi:hypothetical protein
VRRMLLKPELPINPGPVEKAIETSMDAIVSLAPEATTAKASRESTSAGAAAPKTKLKGFSFGGSSKGKKGDAFQEWKRSKPEKLGDSSASAGEASASKALALDAAATGTTGAQHVPVVAAAYPTAELSGAGPSLPLAPTATTRPIEEAKTSRRTFGTPAPGPIMMPFA